MTLTRQAKSVTLDWPGWVQFWELGLFLSRPEAVWRMGGVLAYPREKV
jgi:hypothetical protein